MKYKFITLTLCFGFLMILCSCLEKSHIMNYDSKEYIELYDYTTITFSDNELIITQDDIESIVETEMSVNEAYVEIYDRDTITENDILLLLLDNELCYYYLGTETMGKEFDSQLLDMKKGESKILSLPENQFLNITIKGIYRIPRYEDTNVILDFYGFSSLDELTTFILQRAKEEIVFNHKFDMIFEKSVIKNIPNEVQSLIDADIEASTQEILTQFPSIESFLLQFDMKYEDFVSAANVRYCEIMLYKAILDNEGLTVSDKEIADLVNETANSEHIEYSQYDAYEELAYKKARQVLINNISIATE